MSKKIAQSVEELIGQTPMLKLNQSLKDLPQGEWIKDKGFQVSSSLEGELLAKIEYMNPGGSIKDRVALSIIQGAERSGKLKAGATIVESTSGNTGAGLAMCAAVRGYKTVFVMPDKISAEKINALRAYGAKVYVCPTAVAPDDPRSYYSVARRLSQEIPNAFLANQYFNEDNPRAHYETTAPEIWDQCEGKIDYLFVGAGTGGTICGNAKYLKERNPNLKVIAIDPVGSIYYDLITAGKEVEAHTYLVEGVGEDIIPGTIDFKLIDDCVFIRDHESFAASRMLAQKEGLLVGGSCGMAFWGAVQYLQKVEADGNKNYRAVVVIPDSGSRYLSKVFNPIWLDSHGVNKNWGGLKLGADVEYVEGAKPVAGV